ncbi:tetratricopeptide repeat protein [Gimesia sp.]|uniref:tetratricopeptide repeat protein n=1 Tax=Gimesia sp. TaxID=2024833 RepID=UPI0032EBDA61
MRKRLIILIAIFCLVFLIWIVAPKSSQIDPAQADEIIQTAEHLLADQQQPEAIDMLLNLLEVAPDNQKATFLLGHCYYQQKNYEQAANQFGSILPESEYYQPALMNSAKAYLKTARMEQAERALKQFLHNAPASPSVITELQWLYFNQFRVREAKRLLSEALPLCQNPYPLLYHLLQIEYFPPIAQESISLLKRINDAEPGQASIVLALGYCYWKLGQTDRARELIDQSLTINPTRLETILTAADFYLETGDLRKSQKLLQPPKAYPDELQKQLQHDDRWHFLKSRLHFQNDELPQALEEIQLALKLNPNEIKYLQHSGTLYQASGEYESAQKQFQQTKKMARSYQELYKFVASGALDKPTREDCQRIASHLETLEKKQQARLWKNIAASM